MTQTPCPCCNRGYLVDYPVTQTFEAGGQVQTHTHTETHCNHCGSDDLDAIRVIEAQQSQTA